jgi:hypothetical protein
MGRVSKVRTHQNESDQALGVVQDVSVSPAKEGALDVSLCIGIAVFQTIEEPHFDPVEVVGWKVDPTGVNVVNGAAKLSVVAAVLSFVVHRCGFQHHEIAIRVCGIVQTATAIRSTNVNRFRGRDGRFGSRFPQGPDAKRTAGRGTGYGQEHSM